MKIWHKLKHPLYLVILILILAFLRYVNHCVPSRCPAVFWYPGVFVRLLSEALFSSEVILLEVVFWLLAFALRWMLPADAGRTRWLRTIPALVLLFIWPIYPLTK